MCASSAFRALTFLCLPRAWAVIIPLLATMTRLLFSKKRIIRILPSYYVVLTAWLIYQHLRSGISVSSVFANYLCVDFLASADFQTLWYMNGVWIYYLFALFLVPLCQNASLRRKILLFFLCAAFSVPFFLGYPAHVVFAIAASFPRHLFCRLRCQARRIMRCDSDSGKKLIKSMVLRTADRQGMC